MQPDIQLLNLVLAETMRMEIRKCSCFRCRNKVLRLPGALWGFLDLTVNQKGLALALFCMGQIIEPHVLQGSLSLPQLLPFLLTWAIYVWNLNTGLNSGRFSWLKDKTETVHFSKAHRIQVTRDYDQYPFGWPSDCAIVIGPQDESLTAFLNFSAFGVSHCLPYMKHTFYYSFENDYW